MACRKVETRGRRLFGLNTELGKQLDCAFVVMVGDVADVRDGVRFERFEVLRKAVRLVGSSSSVRAGLFPESLSRSEFW
jgi:BioD-like phosphotransacetylase family protein